MKFQKLLLVSFGMFSSSLVWAAAEEPGALTNPIYTGNWENPSQDSIPVGQGLENRVLNHDGELDGTIQYSIADDYHTYYFKLRIMGKPGTPDQYCYIEDASLIGQKIYKVEVKNVLSNDKTSVNCEVNISPPEDNKDYNPELVLKHLSYLNYKYVKQVEFFTSNEGKHYLALVEFDDENPSEGGVHIVEWINSQTGPTFKDLQTIKIANVEKIEFFPGENGKNTEYLLIGVNDGSSTSYIDIWYTNGYNSGTPFSRDNSYSGKLPTKGVKDIKYFNDGTNNYLVIANGGTSALGFNHYSTVHKWQVGQANFSPTPMISYQTYGAQSIETVQSGTSTWIALANKNNDKTYDVDSSVWKFDNNKNGHYYNHGTGTEDLMVAETLGAIYLENVNVGTKSYLLTVNSNYDVNKKSTELSDNTFDTVLRGLTDSGFDYAYKLAAPRISSWKTVQIKGLTYLLPGFNSAHKETDTLIYGWCEGNEYVNNWCHQAQPTNSKVRGYSNDIPTPDITAFVISGWESVTMEGKTYLIRFDKTGTATKGVQILEADIDLE